MAYHARVKFAVSNANALTEINFSGALIILVKILPIMLALCSMLLYTYYAQNYAGIIGRSLIISQNPTTRDPISDETNCRANLTTKHLSSKHCNSVVLTILVPWPSMQSQTPFSIKNKVSKLLSFPILHSSKEQTTYISISANHRVTLQNNCNDRFRTNGALNQQIHFTGQKADKITANGSIRQIIMRVLDRNDPQP